jgi:hypothetical protein
MKTKIKISASHTLSSLLLGFAILFLLTVVVFRTVPIAQAETPLAHAQVWGERYRSGGYWNVQAYVYTPNPSISSPNWVSNPVGITLDFAITLVESGPTKACDLDCGRHPYGSWVSSSGGGEFVDLTINLSAGGLYRYKSYYLSNNNWQAAFCGGSGCTNMITGNLGVNKMYYIVDGGESNGSGVKWGTITNKTNTYKPYNSSTTYSWCYTATHINVSGGSVSTCSTSNYSWGVIYP